MQADRFLSNVDNLWKKRRLVCLQYFQLKNVVLSWWHYFNQNLVLNSIFYIFKRLVTFAWLVKIIWECWKLLDKLLHGGRQVRQQQLNNDLEDVGISQPWKTEKKRISSCRIHFSLHCILYSDFTIAVADESCDDFYWNLLHLCRWWGDVLELIYRASSWWSACYYVRNVCCVLSQKPRYMMLWPRMTSRRQNLTLSVTHSRPMRDFSRPSLDYRLVFRALLSTADAVFGLFMCVCVHVCVRVPVCVCVTTLKNK